jgi:TolA-binding protein
MCKKFSFNLKDILTGAIFTKGWFRRQLWLIILIGFLIFIRISAGYQAERQQHKLSQLEKKLEDVQFMQLSAQAQLMQETKQSAISKILTEKGSKVEPSKDIAIRIL